MRGVRSKLAGSRYGLLLVMAEAAPPPGRGESGGYWLCRCDCGQLCMKWGHDLTRATGPRARWVHSCGCRKETAAAIGRAVNRDPLAGYGVRAERKARERDNSVAANRQLLKDWLKGEP